MRFTPADRIPRLPRREALITGRYQYRYPMGWKSLNTRDGRLSADVPTCPRCWKKGLFYALTAMAFGLAPKYGPERAL